MIQINTNKVNTNELKVKFFKNGGTVTVCRSKKPAKLPNTRTMRANCSANRNNAVYNANFAALN